MVVAACGTRERGVVSGGGHLSGRRCLIVGGGGGGIGTAVVLAAADAGAAVGFVTNVDEHARTMIDQVRATGAPCEARVTDATDEHDLSEAMAALSDRLGRFDRLVNVVGGNLADDYQRAAEFDLAALDRVMARNLRYAVVSCREFARTLIERGEPGAIVNISSLASRGAPLLGAYAAAKAGLDAYSRTMAIEWGPRGIRVNVVSLGTIRTPRTGMEDDAAAARSIPLRRRGRPEEAAAAVMFLLSEQASYITGHTLAVDGGLTLGHAGGDEPSALVTRPDVRARFAD
jgi:NAD(P)-dependent dehydrogenase (short-subunit alcohol dehydrogenase family)